MANSDIVESELIKRAQQPASATVDGRSATGHNLRDLIAYHRYLKSLEDDAAGTPPSGYLSFGVKTARIEPGGSA